MRTFSHSIASIACMLPLLALAQPFSAEQVEQIQQITHDYLLQHPNLLREMAKKLQSEETRKQADAMDTLKQEAPAIIRADAKAYFESPNSPTVGSEKPDVFLVEFFDYRCGHCRAINPTLNDVIKSHPSLQVIYKELPIFKGDSHTAALAALAANQQGHFHDFHNLLMQTSMPLNEDKIMSAARHIGLNVKALKRDMQKDTLQAEIDQNMRLAKALLEKNVGYIFTPVMMVASADYSHIELIPGGTNRNTLNDAIRKAQWQQDHHHSMLHRHHRSA